MNKPIYGATVGTPFNPKIFSDGVAEALSSKAPCISETANITEANAEWDWTYIHDTLEAPTTNMSISGKSTQDTSGGLAPNTPCEIVSGENPTIVIAQNELEENPQTITFNGITLRKLSDSYKDEIVVRNGRIILKRRVLCIKDFSNANITAYANHGFMVQMPELQKVSIGAGLCNMLKYASSVSTTAANSFTVMGGYLFGLQITEIKNGMSVADWKAKYAANMELLVPLSQLKEEDITEQFVEFLNLKTGEGQTVVKALNCSSFAMNYVVDTKTYINSKLEEIENEFNNLYEDLANRVFMLEMAELANT